MATLIWHHADTFLSLLRSCQRCYNQSGDGTTYSLVVYDYLYLTEIKTVGSKEPDSTAGARW